MITRRCSLGLFALCLMARPVEAQAALGLNATDTPRPAIAAGGTASDPAPPYTSRYPLITFDHRSSAVAALPFDQPFLLSDPGDSSLLQVTLWYPRSNQLTDDECRVGPPPDSVLERFRQEDKRRRDSVRAGLLREFTRRMENGELDTTDAAKRKWLDFPKARWTRAAGQGNAVLLPVNGLPPNRDFTFCVESVNTPSASEAAEFQKNAIRNLHVAVVQALADSKQVSDSLIHTAEILYTFHSALRRALPSADSLIFGPGSILRPAPNPRDPKFTKTLVEHFVAFSNADYRRLNPLQVTNRVEPQLAAKLVGLNSGKALEALARAATSSDVPTRLARAAAMAFTVAHLDANEASGIAWGQRPLDKPTQLFDLGRPERRSGVELSVWIANLDTTGSSLRDLSELAAWLAQPPAPGAKRAVSAADATKLEAALESSRIDVLNMRAQLTQIHDALDRMDASIEDLAATVSSVDFMRVGIRGTSSHVYETRAHWYLSQDLGVLFIRHGSDVQEAAGYVGANFYLRAVNKDAPLGGWCFATHISCFLRRFSLTLGVTATNVEAQDRYRGVLGGKALYTGAGFRIADFFRVNYGAPFAYTYSPDSRRRPRLTAFSGFGLSLDFQLKDLISDVANAITP